MGARDRDRRPARRQPYREPKPKLLIVCEGENTERQYFEQFSKFHRYSPVDVIVASERGKPLYLVRQAKKLRSSALSASRREGDPNLKYDSVWCVFDRDEHPHVPEAQLMASKNGIHVALSNPCFELWLFLHFKDSPGLVDQRMIQAKLKKHVPSYDKNIDLEKYHHGYEEAVRRARQLEKSANELGEPGRNPSTGVHVLTEIIKPSIEPGASSRT